MTRNGLIRWLWVSPDKAYLAAWRAHDQSVVVWDANSGELIGTPAEAGPDVGPMAWSPDSKSLVYVQNESYCPPSGPAVLVRLDLPDLAPTELFRSNKLAYQTATWDEPDLLHLTDETGQGWTYHFSTGQMEPLP